VNPLSQPDKDFQSHELGSFLFIEWYLNFFVAMHKIFMLLIVLFWKSYVSICVFKYITVLSIKKYVGIF
jgi:hypothetical protein